MIRMKIANKFMNIIHMNRERYEEIVDHCSYAHNLSDCEIEVKAEINSGLNGI